MHNHFAGCDHRLRLLTPQHRPGNLRRIRQVCQARLLDHHPGLGQALLQFLLQCGRDFLHPAAERDLPLLAVVVGIDVGQMPQCRLALHMHKLLVILDIEQGLRGVLHPPHHHGPDFNRVPTLVVDLEFLSLEVTRAE